MTEIPMDGKAFGPMSRDPGIHSRIAECIAPGIRGMDTVKKAFALAMFSGKGRPDGYGGYVRGDVSILAAGDVTMGWSSILRSASYLCQGSEYTHVWPWYCAGTDQVVSDLPISAFPDDGGLMCIDGIEMLDDDVQKGLSDMLETGFYSAGGTLCKGGHPVLAVCNPKYKRFIEEEPMADQLDLDVRLLSRFDLVLVCTDNFDNATDLEVAESMLAGEMCTWQKPPYDADTLRRYISYARTLDPVMTREASEVLEDAYLALRDQMRMCTPRQLSSMIKMSKAFSRMRLGGTVSEGDAEKASDLMFRMLEDVRGKPEGVIPGTGLRTVLTPCNAEWLRTINYGFQMAHTPQPLRR